VDPVLDEQALDVGDLLHEPLVLGRDAEPHHPFHPGAGIPGPIEQHNLAGGGQVGEVALEVPLGALALARLLQRHHPGPAWVQVLGEPLDRAPLAGGVAALEHDNQPLAGGLEPVLELQQLDLQQPLGPLVLLAPHLLGIGIALAPGVHRPTVGTHQHRLVVVAIVHPQVRQLVQQVAGLGRGADVDDLVVSAHPNSLDSSGVR
jgi:hypothetical protein